MMINYESHYKTNGNEDNPTGHHDWVSHYEPPEDVFMRGQETKYYNNNHKGYSHWTPSDQVVATSKSTRNCAKKPDDHRTKYRAHSSKAVVYGRNDAHKPPIYAYGDNSFDQERNNNQVHSGETYRKNISSRKVLKKREFERAPPLYSEYHPRNTATKTSARRKLDCWNANNNNLFSQSGELYFLRKLARSIKNRISLLEYRIANERDYQRFYGNQNYRGEFLYGKEREKTSTIPSAKPTNVICESDEHDQAGSAYCSSLIVSNTTAEKHKYQTVNTTQGPEVDLYINAEEREGEFEG